MCSLRHLALAAALALSIVPTSSPAEAGKPYKNIVQTAREAGGFTILIKALEATDLIGTLSAQGKGRFTVFAPTDAAFAKLPAGVLDGLLADPVALKNILLYHVAAGQLLAADVVTKSSILMVNGGNVDVSLDGGPKVNDAAITATDVRARNGVIHVIDTVLLPR